MELLCCLSVGGLKFIFLYEYQLESIFTVLYPYKIPSLMSIHIRAVCTIKVLFYKIYLSILSVCIQPHHP
jgi:hypothetical protein